MKENFKTAFRQRVCNNSQELKIYKIYGLQKAWLTLAAMTKVTCTAWKQLRHLVYYIICLLFFFFSFHSDSPTIVAISGNQTVNEGDVLNLNCTADGNPPPSIAWTKLFENISVFFPLTITGKENEGVYRCTSDNGVGKPASRESLVLVKSKFVTILCN